MLGIYCRISREKEIGRNTSIEDQQQSGIELAEKLNCDFEVYIDEGLSGTLPIEQRPSLSKLIDDIYDGKINSVFIYDQSRLERSPEARFVLNKIFRDENIKLYTETGLVGDDMESEFQGDLLSVINNFYVKLTTKKVKSALRRNLINGKVHAIPPYGYTKDENNIMIVDELQSSVVKRIFEYSLSGIGTNKIAEILNFEKIPTKYNLFEKGGTLSVKNKYTGVISTRKKSDIRWNGGTIRNIITNPTYKGVRVFSGVEYNCPPVFDKKYWQKVNDNLKNNSNNSGKSTEHKYLLKGLIRCGRCGRNYYGRTRISKKDNYYMCSSKRHKDSNCGNRSLNIDVLDDLIWTRFIGDGKLVKLIEDHFNQVNTIDFIKEIETKIKSIYEEIKINERNKNKLLDLILTDVLTNEEVKSKMHILRITKDELEIKLFKLEEQLKYFKNNSTSKESLLKQLDFQDLEISYIDKKMILQKYIRDIRIYYDDIKNYFIEIHFNLPEMESIVFVLENHYKFAHSIIDSECLVDQNILILILDKKLDVLFQKGEEVNMTMFYDSKKSFEDLKLKYEYLQ